MLVIYRATRGVERERDNLKMIRRRRSLPCPYLYFLLVLALAFAAFRVVKVQGWVQPIHGGTSRTTTRTSSFSTVTRHELLESSTRAVRTGISIRIHPRRRSTRPHQAAASIDDSATESASVSASRLDALAESIQQLTRSGSDIRGRFIRDDNDDDDIQAAPKDGIPALTPLAAYCLGQGLARLLRDTFSSTSNDDKPAAITVGLGMDPRWHGTILAEALARGLTSASASASESLINVKCNTQICTTPAMATFCRMQKCQAAVMVTASHLPGDRNGFKIYLRDPHTHSVSGFSKAQIRALGDTAVDVARQLSSSDGSAETNPQQQQQQPVTTIQCAELVDWMPDYAASLKQAILSKTTDATGAGGDSSPLKGLKIVLNAGNGAAGFFANVLQDLGADCTSCSIHLQPDGSFPNGGPPNPENPAMFQQTKLACEAAQADLGIMFDTDGDRSGFVLPRTVVVDDDDKSRTKKQDYEALNRNRLIALLGVIFARQEPGCIIVTDSVTSEGLAAFLEKKLGLQHVRFKKGYANVINKAIELNDVNRASAGGATASAEVAIETSGHCAMRENDFLDDGTYAAVQVVSLLAREKRTNAAVSLLDLISDMEELDEVAELRMAPVDGSLDSTGRIFEVAQELIESQCRRRGSTSGWSVDEDNLEGIRVRVREGTSEGQFFMLRKSLHDPVLSLQIEAASKEEAQDRIVAPLIELLESDDQIKDKLDISILRQYLQPS